MKTLFVAAALCLSITSVAKADMFDDAHTMGMSMTQHVDTSMLPSTAGARVRVDQINTIAPSVANALIAATSDRTEENREKTCQLANRFDETFEGIETLDGYNELAPTIIDLRDAVGSARTVLNCGGFVSSFCAGPVQRTLNTKWIETNGASVDTSMSYQGVEGGQGTYRMPDGTTGVLSQIQCGNNGMTVKARWLNQRSGLSGYLSFYYTDRAATEFVGVWGFDNTGFKKFQGFWDGKLSNGSTTTTQVPADGAYTIIGGLGKCLDVRDHSLAPAAQMQQWDCTGEPHQTFQLRRVNADYHVLVTQSGMCISAEGNKPDNGVNMIQWNCQNSPDQLVKLVPSINGYFTIRFQATGKCMDVQDTSDANGLPVHQWDCVGVPDQNWKFVPTGSSSTTTPSATAPNPNVRYALVSRLSNRCLDAINGSIDNGTDLQQWQCSQNGAQAYHFRAVGDGWYNIVNDASGRCVSSEAVRTNDGNPFILWDCNGGNDQKVRLEASANGAVRLIYAHSGKCQEVLASATNDGARIDQWTCNGAPNQDWYLAPF